MPPVRSNNSVRIAYNTQSAEQGGNGQSVVQPTGFNQPVGASKAGIELAKSMISKYAADNFSGSLPGEPVKLLDLLRRPIPAEQRKPMILQYWTTYFDWAMWVNEQEVAQWLNRIPSPSNTAEKAMLDVARVDARNRVLAAKIQLGKSQSKLVQYLPSWNSELLPIPNDLPLIQKYKTNYEIYKSYQLMPANLRGIDRMLPDTLELIANRAGAVQLCKDAASKILDALSARQATTAYAIDVSRQCRFLNKDLVASVINYNQAIADYSLTVARGYQTPEQIEAMLIAKPKIDTNDVAQRFKNATQQQRRLNAQNVSSPNGTGAPRLIGSRPGQPSSNPGQANGSSPNFDLNAQRAFQGSGQTTQPNSRPGQSVIRGNVAPATPVGKGSFGGRPANPSGGTFGPQLPTQPSQNQQNSTQGSGTRSAQSPFGPGIGR